MASSRVWNGFRSRRSPVYSRYGMVAASQPLAVEAGLDVMRRGGNAVDAAIAVASCLNVTEPCSTGLGGDCFLLYYEAATKKVHAINGSGRSSKHLTLSDLRTSVAATKTTTEFPDKFDAKTVTVPGTARGWEDAVNRFGTWSLDRVLEPAIRLAEDGFPVSPIAAHFWEEGAAQIRKVNASSARELLVRDNEASPPRAPKAGEIFRNPSLAATLRDLARHGATRGFYEGRVGKSIVRAVQSRGGALDMDDLKEHASSFPSPIKTRYRGVDVYEHPPNGQGLVALLAFSMLEGIDSTRFDTTASEVSRLHLQIEALRLAFADGRQYVTDPDHKDAPKETPQALLSPEYARKRRCRIDERRATADVRAGSPFASSDTVSFQVVDRDGNAVSMVNSNYMGFGTGIVPEGTGFTLQNRGANFSLDPTHANRYEPQKRPYHTIIPGIALWADTGDLFCSFTNMGGFMQPQGHVQIMSNLLDRRMDAQAAVDAPRFCIKDGTSGGEIAFENGISVDTIDALRKMGHNVHIHPVCGDARSVFGRAQIIVRDHESGVLCGGSDCRADGLAMGLARDPREGSLSSAAAEKASVA
eukprot:g2761.t1